MMLSFHQITQKFQSFRTLNGLALFDQQGQFVDTSLPLSDELCEEIGNIFKEMVATYQAKGRNNNRFIVEINSRVFLFAEYAEGAFLFMMRDTSEIDALLGAFTHLYGINSNNDSVESITRIEKITAPVKEIVLPEGVVEDENHSSLVNSESSSTATTPSNSKRSVLNWALPSAAAAVALTIGISAATSFASPDDDPEDIAAVPAQLVKGADDELVDMEREEQRLLAEKKAAAMRLAEAAKKIKEARLAAEAAEAEKMRLAKEAEAARIAAELKAAEEVRLAEAKRIAKKKAAATKTVSTKKKSYKKKSTKTKKDFCTRG